MKRTYVAIAILIIFTIVAFGWWKNGTSSANPKDKSPKIFIIEPGQGVREVAKNLKDKGLIKDQIIFFLLTKKLGIDNKIQAGDYRLFSSMSANDIAQEFTHGTLDVWITVPEGQRAGQIAQTLKEKMPNYDPSWDAVLEQNEGYLFPDTYLFPRGADINTIVSIMRNNFDNKYKDVDTTKTSLTKEQIVTLASLIEREARLEEDRPIVSSVIHNRLNLGMKLDIDATLQYIKGYDKTQNNWWTKSIYNEDKLINSSYNTYANQGLPPGPISNPGLSSLQAAANPTSTDYLYYITDSTGKNRYAKTIQQHQANIDKYGL